MNKYWLLVLPLIFAMILTIACSTGDDDDNDDENDDDTENDDESLECTGSVCIDQNTGLMWQNQLLSSALDWHEATDYCQEITLEGFSDWRLPTISELRSLIRDCPKTETGGNCGVTDDCLSVGDCWDNSCEGCETGAGPNDGCYRPSGFYDSCGYDWFWSSSLIAEYPFFAFVVNFINGHIDNYNAGDIACHIRCIR